jgi:hypothetical protein
MSEHIISHDQLIKVAGQERYKRGLAASEAHAVLDFNSNSGRISGSIQGFESKVRINGEVLEGACSCKDSDGFDFCQHCVHLVLFSNKRAQQLFSLSKGPDKSKIFAYLLAQEKQILAKHLLAFIEQDAAELDRFLLKATLSSGQIDFPELRARVTELTRPNKRLFSQRQVKHYFSRIASLFNELQQADLTQQSEQSLKLIEYSIARLNGLCQVIDETWGYAEPIFKDVQSLFALLFSMHEGRTLTIVKRFEKIFFVDQFEVLGEQAVVVLEQHTEAHKLFFERAVELWQQSQTGSTEEAGDEISGNVKKDPKLQNLIALKEEWQWRKLANLVVGLDVPDKQNAYQWSVSLQRFLVTSSESCLSWAKSVDTDYGAESAIDVLQEGVTRFPNSQRLVDFLCSLLGASDASTSGYLRLAGEQPIELIAWLTRDNNEISLGAAQAMLPILVDRLKSMRPRAEFDDLPNQARVKLVDLCKRYSKTELAFQLAMESELPLETKINLANEFDQLNPDLARQVRERILPELLAKKQNRFDHHAAEQTVFLQKNYSQLQLSAQQFEQALKPSESLMSERKNFISLVQQYSEKK